MSICESIPREKSDARYGKVSAGLLTAAVALLAFSGLADTVRLLKDVGTDANTALYGESQYTASQLAVSNSWAKAYTDGRVPHAGADYLLAGDTGYANSCRSCIGDSSHSAFLGDSLQIGVVGGSAFNLHQRANCYSDGSVSAEFKNLILEKGSFYWSATMFENVSTWYRMTGAVTVNSPASAPFEFYSMQPAVRPVWRLASNITGASGTGLKFYTTRAAEGYGVVYNLQGDNSAYQGSYAVTSSRTYLCFSGNAALGANKAADAITLSNGGGVGVFEGTVTLSSGAGVKVESSGGTLYAESGCTVTFSLPVTGTGAVRVVGGGRFILDGTWSAGDIEVAEGSLEFGPNAVFTKATTVRVRAGCTCSTTAPANVTVVSDPGAMYLLPFTSSTPTVTPIVVTSADTMPFLPMAFCLPTAFVRPAPTNRYKVLEVPVSVQTVTVDDFYVHSLEPFGERFEVETDGTTQSVYIAFPNFVESLDINNNAALWRNGEDWVNSYDKTVAATNAYWCQHHYYDSYGVVQRDTKFKVPFPGYSFSLVAPTGKTFVDLQFHQKNTSQNIPDLRLYHGANWTLANAGKLSLAGRIRVHATDDNPAALVGVWDRTEKLDAKLTGDGTLCFIGSYDANHSGSNYFTTVYLNGDNRRFIGNLDFGPHPSYISDKKYKLLSDESNYSTNVIKTAAALGGEPGTPTYDSVRLRGTSVLQVSDDVEYVRTNRGTYFELAPRLVVDADKSFTLDTPKTFHGKLRKYGAGTLVWGGAAPTFGALGIATTPSVTSNELSIVEGGLVIRDGAAMNGLKLTLAAGATLTLAVDGTFSGWTNTVDAVPIAIAGDTLPVRLRWTADGLPQARYRIPVVTVSGAAADTLRDRIELVKPADWESVETFVQEKANADGSVTFVAVVKPRKGLVLLLGGLQ